MTTDPQTAADAAERVQAFVDGRPWLEPGEPGAIVMTVPDPDRTRGRWLHLYDADLRALLAERARMVAELEQVRGELASTRDDSSEAWLGKRIEALRKVLRDQRDATRAARIEADGLRRELDEATGIVADIGEALNTTELYIALGDLAQLFAPRTAALVERERAEAIATRPAGSTPAAGDKRTPEQWGAEYDIQIADSDGWRGTGDPAWDEPIALPEYLQRAARSTTRGLTPDVWNRLSRDAHRAAEADEGPQDTPEGP